MIEKARRSSKAVTFQYHSPYVDKEFLTSYIIRGDRLISTQMDVTARKQMESALLESEARCKVAEAIESERRRLYDVLETLPVMICLLTADHHVAFANRSFREKFGESRGRHCYEFRFGRTKPCEFCEAYKVLETGQPHKWEVIVSDGSVLEVYNLPFTNVDGSPMILEMDIDITERKKAEEKLKESEEKYRNIVETSNEGIYFVNDEAKVTYANKIMETSGYSLKEIIGRPIWNFISEESLPEAKRNFEKRKQGINESYELKLIRKDGSFIWGFINAKPFFNKKGRFKGYLAMLTDITERKIAEEKLRESEEKYRNIVETVNEGILITDNEATITYVNNKVVNTIGYTLEELIGKPIWGFISEEYRPIVKLNLEKRKQGISESYELKLIHKNGSSLWVLINSKPLFDKNGNYMGVMSLLTDITQRKEAEQALANIEIARKKEIHHRIKNNLQVISSLLDLQAEQFRGRKDIKDLEVLEAFKESQDRVISMALIHEELYKGGGFETLNFSPYIEELADNLFRTYKLQDTDISLDMDMEENVFFNMDTAVPLGMIINELVSNSFKHGFPGRDKGEIRIKLRRENGEYRSDGCKSNFVLAVSDDGIGIPENLDIEDLDSLGLQLVTSLVGQLDGKLELKRENGTEFIIRFTVIDNNNQATAP
jgi:PAS domain S-box-containing protein